MKGPDLIPESSSSFFCSQYNSLLMRTMYINDRMPPPCADGGHKTSIKFILPKEEREGGCRGLVILPMMESSTVTCTYLLN